VTGPAGDPVLVLDGARYWYAGSRDPALDGASVQVAPGEVVAVVGPNGSGKTSLCLVAAGLAPQAIGGRLEGTVTVGTSATRDLRPHELAARVGILFQNPDTQLSGTAPTVWEEVAFGPRNLGLSMPEVAHRVDEALSVLQLWPLGPRDPQRLSGGQGQLIALASVMALRPSVLVLDEPTSQLDPVGTRLVGEAIARLAATGAAVLVTEHKTDLLLEVAQRAVLLRAGRVAASGSLPGILDQADGSQLGVELPARMRVVRALRAAGLDPGVLPR
jgi:energy-coupling factor transporter ATP-binding protein EcfA2